MTAAYGTPPPASKLIRETFITFDVVTRYDPPLEDGTYMECKPQRPPGPGWMYDFTYGKDRKSRWYRFIVGAPGEEEDTQDPFR